MPRDTAVVVAVIALPFVIFAVVLAWADFRSAHSRRPR